MPGTSFDLQCKGSLKTANACKNGIEFTVYQLCECSTCLHNCSFSSPVIKQSISYLFLLLTIGLPFEFLLYRAYLLCFAPFSPVCLLGSIVLHYPLRMLSILMSVIPNSAGLPCGTTRNLHNLSLFLDLIITLYTPNELFCFILCAEYDLFICVCNRLAFALGNNTLNISRVIKLSSLPEYTLRSNFYLLSSAAGFQFCYDARYHAINFRDVKCTMSMCLSISSSELYQLLLLVCCILCKVCFLIP